MRLYPKRLQKSTLESLFGLRPLRPAFILGDRSLLQRMAFMVRRIDSYLLAGSAEYPKFGKKPIKLKSGNTALFLSPEGKVLGQYLKIYLIPFGEYVPYEEIIQWPEFIVPKGMNSNEAGTEPILFEVDGTKFGTLICSEILYPELGRRMVKKGAGFLVNISNEAWFGKSAYSYQSLSISVFRAVENRVNLVRSTNTGISGFIDPYGRITARLTNGGEDLFVEGTLTREILLSSPGTFYTRFGDVFRVWMYRLLDRTFHILHPRKHLLSPAVLIRARIQCK